jgi:hypothetical protein
VYGGEPPDTSAVRVVECPAATEGAGGEIVTVGGGLTVNWTKEVVYVEGTPELSVTLAQ